MECPSALWRLWEWFMQLHNARDFTDIGAPKPLMFSEIAAWAEIMQVELVPFDVTVIKLLDNVALTKGGEKNGG